MGSTNPSPTIKISASPTSISSGESATLTVTATNASEVTVSGSNGSSYTLQANGGSVSVSPKKTTTYTATATGSGGTTTATVTVTMASAPTPPPTVSIVASPTSIVDGGSSTLTVTATNATAVTITGDGSSYTLKATGGTQPVSPSITTTYTATATGPGGKTSAMTSVSVGQPATPTVQIVANPMSVATGGTSTLTVTATNATAVTVSGTDGSNYTLAATGGTQIVSPAVTTVYTATATGTDETVTAVVTVTVVPPVMPTVTISANPTSITSGNSSVLTVAATNATSVVVTGSNGTSYTLQATGGTTSVSPTATTTYTATANGPGGTETATATVTVAANTAPTVTITADPNSINAGGSSVLTVVAANATSVKVTGTDGSSYTLTATGGAQTVSPTSTTTYTATATGSGGTASSSVKIEVGTSSSPVVTVNTTGTGSGTVTSSPAGINCPGTCTATFSAGAAVVLTAAPASGTTFAGWSGACTGLTTCNLTVKTGTSVTATFEQGTANIDTLQHIIFFAQENRSLDEYLGTMRQYWKQNGIPDQSFDGLPQFNPTSGSAPLYGPPPAIPGCDPTSPYPGDCNWDPSNLVTSFPMISVCNENTSPSWNEAHVDWNYLDQVGDYPAKNNGFVHTAAKDARTNPGHPFFDTNGLRAMGYLNGTQLNYDYFMASNFATSDRFFQPVMSRTQVNREYIDAATSEGHALPNGTDAADTPQLTAPIIFEELQNAGISWKVYVNPEGTKCPGPPYQPSCLIQTGYLQSFTYAKYILDNFPQNVAPISQYFTDLADGTLPQVAEIEPASDAGLDEHGSVSDSSPTNIQAGARYTSSLINALMASSYWKNSAFILFFDESGGLYDHVAPQPAVNPDGIAPIDLESGYVCDTVKGPTCNFVYTGYRIPMYVVSPYAKKNYVSHTVMDSTAILKFIEERFNLPPLSKRDAAQPDMSEFFDFNNPPWMSAPTPPLQNVSSPCYLDKVP